MRSISIGFPSGKAKLTLWENTEDAESFIVHGIKSDKPYVTAYNIKYYLTDDEKQYLKSLRKSMGYFKEV